LDYVVKLVPFSYHCVTHVIGRLTPTSLLAITHVIAAPINPTDLLHTPLLERASLPLLSAINQLTTPHL